MGRMKLKDAPIPRFHPNGTTAAARKDKSMHLATGIDHGQPHVGALWNIGLLSDRVPHAQFVKASFGGLP